MTTIPARLAFCAFVLLTSGCGAVPTSSTVRDLQARCENTGGRWHQGAVREGFCEYQSPGMI